MTPTHKLILQEFEAYAKTSTSADALMKLIADRLHERMTRYNWVGFYECRFHELRLFERRSFRW